MVFQSTHPHGVRPKASRFSMLCEYVSIHAPARGATFVRFALSALVMFQSTHPHGVRHCLFLCPCKKSRFNPRTRTGCDGLQTGERFFGVVSIHAPARGATEITQAHDLTIKVSIHAPARGATDCHIQVRILVEFQSTHPHGVRLFVYMHSSFGLRFNPRTRTGCDLLSKGVSGES